MIGFSGRLNTGRVFSAEMGVMAATIFDRSEGMSQSSEGLDRPELRRLTPSVQAAPSARLLTPDQVDYMSTPSYHQTPLLIGLLPFAGNER